jgi:hypothetical protein
MGLRARFQEEKAWNKEPGISDGDDAERALFGSVEAAASRTDGYVGYHDAVTIAKLNQPDVLKRSKLIKDLRAKVAELCQDTSEPVKFYTAVGSPLDIYHGVDAFFEQAGRRVTLDVSLREKDRHKADVLVNVGFKKDGALELPMSEFMRVADEVARRLSQSRNVQKTQN